MMAEYNYQKNLKLWRLGSFGFKTPDKISYYYLKDYIGNIRVTVNEQGEIVTKDDYYPFGLRMLERSVNPDLSGPGLSYNNGNENDRLKFQSKRLQDYGFWKTYYFGWRDYDPELGRWFVVDPARQFASPYVAMGNNPIVNYDRDGKFAFIPIVTTLFKIYTIGKTLYNVYKAYENGGHWIYAFSALNQGAISYGFSEAAGKLTSGLIPEGNTFWEDAVSQTANTAIEFSARKTAVAFVNGEKLNKLPKVALRGLGEGALWSVGEQILFGTYRGWDNVSDEKIKEEIEKLESELPEEIKNQKDITEKIKAFKEIYGGYTQGGIIPTLILRLGNSPALEGYGVFKVDWDILRYYKKNGYGSDIRSLNDVYYIAHEFSHFAQMKNRGFLKYWMMWPILHNKYESNFQKEGSAFWIKYFYGIDY